MVAFILAFVTVKARLFIIRDLWRYRRERKKAKILLIEARDQGWSKVEQRRSSCRKAGNFRHFYSCLYRAKVSISLRAPLLIASGHATTGL